MRIFACSPCIPGRERRWRVVARRSTDSPLYLQVEDAPPGRSGGAPWGPLRHNALSKPRRPRLGREAPWPLERLLPSRSAPQWARGCLRGDREGDRQKHKERDTGTYMQMHLELRVI